MRHMRMLIVVTATVFVAAGSARGSTSPGSLLMDNAAVTSSGLSFSPVMRGAESLSKAIFPTGRSFTLGQRFLASSTQNGQADDKKEKDPPPPPPPPRSVHCPPDKDDHHDGNQQSGDNQDKDHHDHCGKGDDGKNP
jgi:hypothetical protein